MKKLFQSRPGGKNSLLKNHLYILNVFESLSHFHCKISPNILSCRQLAAQRNLLRSDLESQITTLCRVSRVIWLGLTEEKNPFFSPNI